MSKSNPEIVFVVGPTAVGKSAVAFELAKDLGAEIISCDSMQVYKEISILSNKPAQRFLDVVPHHLINCVSVTEEYDVVRFSKEALEAIKDILQRNKRVIITGGTGLYMNILLDGIFEGSAKDKQLREELETLAEEKGNEVLYQELQGVDPTAALKIHPNDRRRIIRALEVFKLEGQPISKRQKDRQGIWDQYSIRLFCLDKDRTALYKDIDSRVEVMFKDGAIEEVKKVRNLAFSQTAQGIIGVQDILSFLDGKVSLQTAKDSIKQQTRQYAKRQLTWFRREKRLEWLMIEPPITSRELTTKIKEAMKDEREDKA